MYINVNYVCILRMSGGNCDFTICLAVNGKVHLLTLLMKISTFSSLRF